MFMLWLAGLVGVSVSAAPPREWADLGAPLGGDVYVRELVAAGEVIVARVSPNRGETPSEALLLSRDAGRRWQTIVARAPAGDDLGELGHRVAIAGDVILHHGPRGLMRSADLGKAWQAVPEVRADAGRAGWVARVGARFYATRGDGVAASDDDGVTWSTIAAPAGMLGGLVSAAGELIALAAPAAGEPAVAMRREGDAWVPLGGHAIVGATSQALVARTGGQGGASVEVAVSFDAGRTWGAATSLPLQTASLFASDARILIVGEGTKLLGAVAPAESYRALPPARDAKTKADDEPCRFQRAVVTPSALVAAASCGDGGKPRSRLFSWPLGG